MNFAIAALLLVYLLIVGSWPLVWLFAIAREGIARHWPTVVRLALVLPLWTVAVSVGGLQVATLIAVSAAPEASARTLVAATSLAVALCFAVVAWMLLWRLMADAAVRRRSAFRTAP